MRSSRIRIGCSGWQYRHWAGTFYPKDVPRAQWLRYYARHFDTVEVNNTFYRLPREGMLASWRPSVPSRFLFAVKASRFLTHMKKLIDPADPLDRLFTRAAELRGPEIEEHTILHAMAHGSATDPTTPPAGPSIADGGAA